MTASGSDACAGSVVTNSASATCPITTTPPIAVTLACPAVPVATGGLITYTGTVRNSGNVTLNNVTVVNSQAVPSTVLTVPSLAPGVSANFTASFTAPADACSVSSTVTASGSDSCTEAVVSQSASATCALVTAPRIVVTQSCPASPVDSGGLLTYSGTVSNAGNITLTNVVVTNDRTGTTPVFTRATLAPGAVAGFTGSYTVPVNSGCAVTSTLTANARDKCTGTPVTANAAATCPLVGAANLVVTLACPPTATPLGGLLTFSGTVSNAGNVTLTNVVVATNQSQAGPYTFGTIRPPLAPPAGNVADRFGVGANFNGLTYADQDEGYAATQFYSLRREASGSSTFVTINASGTVTGRFDAGNKNFDALTFAAPDVGYGPVIFYYLRHDSTGVSTFGTIKPGGAVGVVADLFVVGHNFDALTFAATDVGFGANLFYYLRHDLGGGSTFGSINPALPGTTTDRFSVGSGFDALVFTATDVGYGPNLFYYLRHDSTGVSTFGTISATGTVTDRFVVGNNFNELTFTTTDVGFGANLFYFLRGGATGAAQPVFTLASLAPGASANFSGSYGVPSSNACSITTSVSASAKDQCAGSPVIASAEITCPLVTAPRIVVAQTCPANPAAPGGFVATSGSVSNAGNITLTNVSVVSSQPAANTVVFTVASLAPGASASFSSGFDAPLDACSATSTLTATGRDQCTGSAVNHSVTTTCPLVTAPQIAVTKACPVTPVTEGGLLVFTGTVTNKGNITLTNVLVVNSRPAANTPVFGPVTLAPGAGTNFSGSYTAPLNTCSVTDTLTASGRDKCTGSGVTNSATTTCPIITVPRIAVTLACPAVAAETGGPITYSGTVSNPGNVALNNVTVVDSQAVPNTVVLSLASLAPGASANFSASFTAPADACSVSSTAVATGSDACGNTFVTNSASATCALVTTPRLVVRQGCPENPAVPGGLLSYSGSVSNAGNITLTNVNVINDRSGATPVLAAATLAPGGVAVFSGSYVAPTNCSSTSTSTATGRSICGVSVTNSASATCPILTTPRVTIVVVCPAAPAVPGSLLTYSGTVRNAGDITLTNVVVVSDRPAPNTTVFTAAALAPGASSNFTGSYTVPTDVCPVTAILRATGRDLCTGVAVSDTFQSTCPVSTAPAIAVTLACPAASATNGHSITYSGTVRNSGNVTLNNVTVVNNQPAPNTVVYTAPSLAPGGSANFTATFTTPADACSVSSTVTGTGDDNCSGARVSHNASATCPLITTPAIVVTLACPPSPALPGRPLIYSGTVRNAGDVTLTNVQVFDSQSGGVTYVTNLTYVTNQIITTNISGSTNPITTVGLVGYWAFDEASGSVALDGSGLGNNGTITRAVRVPGYSGGALSFSGSRTSVDIPNNSSLNFSGPITLSAWINPQSAASIQDIVAHGNSRTSGGDVYLRINNGRYEVGSGSSGPAASALIPSADLMTFVHLAGVYDGAAWTLYRNGAALNTTPSSSGALTLNANWAIGSGLGDEGYFVGVVDEARVYNRGLSAAEVLGLTGGGSGGTTNIVLVTNQVVVITTNIVEVPSGSGPPVYAAAALAPGVTASFTGSYLAPTNCSSTSALTATGRSICGVSVTHSASITCPILTAPAIEVTQSCPATSVVPGGILTYSGTVRNIGDITLTNITVFNDRSGTTPIFTLASLAPGAAANFSGSYVTYADCCVDSSTVTAHGQDCTGRTVSDTATRTCPLLTTPAIVVTKVCAPGVLRPGDRLTYSGTVSNAGGITLFNVTVVDNMPAKDTLLLEPFILAPGETASYTGSYIVPLDFCESDTVTASGFDLCTLAQVSSSATATCPVTTTPGIVVTKNCPPSPTPRGGLYTYTGTVRNTGDVTLVNVTVVNTRACCDQDPTNSPVIGPITLAPGAATNFTGSFLAPLYCCEIIDTLTARGQDRCTSIFVSDTVSQVCPLLTTPGITVSEVCPPTTVPVGGTFTYTGSVSNTGDVVLTNVFVVSSQPSANTPVLGPIELAPRETKAFSRSFIVTANSNPGSITLAARGTDTCLGQTVIASADCSGTERPLQITSVTLAEGVAAVTWTATPGSIYRLQWASNVTQSVWGNVPGDVTATSNTASKNDAVGSAPQRFYRVLKP